MSVSRWLVPSRIGITIATISIFWSGPALAVTLSQTSALNGTGIVVTSVYHPSYDLIIYPTYGGCPSSGGGSCAATQEPFAGSNLNYIFDSAIPNGSYTIIEDPGAECFGILSLAACLAYGNGIIGFSYVNFKIGEDGPSTSIGGGKTPVVKLSTKISDQFLSGPIAIQYEVSDEDDARGNKQSGLREKPVSILYNTLDENSFTWDVLKKDQPATGTITWDTTKVPDNRYWLRIVARSRDSDFGLLTTGSFVVDNTPPNFSVTANPSFSEGIPIQIEILPSENLGQAPTATIKQFGHNPIPIQLAFDRIKRTFRGVYEIAPNHDGPAEISVMGMDLAGNTGGDIVSGGTFAVGVKPPLTPKIFSPLSGVVTSTSITIFGSTANAKTVAAKVNGLEEYAANVSDNEFKIENVTLNPLFNKGKNSIEVYAVDQSGKISETALLNLFINSPPRVTILEPRARHLKFKGDIKIRWTASDINDDKLTYQVRLSNDKGNSWKTIADKLADTEYLWDSTEVPDGSNYLIGVVASDGSLYSDGQSYVLTISNNLPTIILESSGDFYLSAAKTFSGSARSKTDLLQKLEWSADGGRAWQEIPAEDGLWDQEFERFSFSIPQIKTGTHNILIRGWTKSGRKVANAERISIFFDNTAPRLYAKSEDKTSNVPFFVLRGSTDDDFAGIDAVEYRIDNSDWFRGTIEKGFRERSAKFKIDHSERLADGKHEIQVRVVDRAKNFSPIKTLTVSIDSTPPRLGSFMLRNRGSILFPAQGGAFQVAPNSTTTFQIAIAGAPRLVRLLINDEFAPIKMNASSGLWEYDFTFGEAEATLKIEAEDELGNKIIREIARLAAKEQKTAASPLKEDSFWIKILRFIKIKP